MIPADQVTAVLWDYDGTLVDTCAKNLSITRAILRRVTGDDPSRFEILASLEAYRRATQRVANWRELYAREFDLDEELIDAAGELWTEYQHRDPTETPVFDGVPEALAELAELPHGILSQNSRSHIRAHLRSQGLLSHFRAVVGYEEVGLRRQKPDPHGFFLCLEELTGRAPSGTTARAGSSTVFSAGPTAAANADAEADADVPAVVVYVGDHETDARCAAAANARFEREGAPVRVISVGAFYGVRPDTSAWAVRPDFEVTDPREISRLLAVRF